MSLYNKSGVYVIINKKNGRMYIGATKDLGGRNRHHLGRLKENDHHNPFLQKVYDEYGPNIFEFKVLLFCEEFELSRYEQSLVDYYGVDNLYNIREYVDSNLGLKHSSDTIEKMSFIKMGKKNPFYGMKHTEDVIEENRLSSLGKNNPFFGKKHSTETIEKLRDANAKLSRADVKEIRRLLKQELSTIKGIAEKYGVSGSTIRDIRNGRTWKNV